MNSDGGQGGLFTVVDGQYSQTYECLDGATQGIIERDRGMKQAESNALERWKKLAIESIEKLARRQQFFTTDDVWEHLEMSGCSTHENRAMGSMMRKACNEGWILATDNYIPTRRPDAHRRPVRVWESKIYQAEAV